MMRTLAFDARYFDGKTGHAQQARVKIRKDGLAIDAQGETVIWLYEDLIPGPKNKVDIRLSNKKTPDAALALPLAAQDALHDAAPEIFSGAHERRRMAALIAALVIGAGLVTGGIFFGVPAASGPMAKRTPKDLEIQIGENLAAQINTFLKPCGSEEASAAISPVIDDLATSGEVGFPIRFQFVKASAPNAFALPGGQVMATSGLMTALGDDQEAFLAVIAHELGHVRARDGMQAVYRNAGLGAALEIITGGSGAAQQAVLVGGQISQLRHTRIQETAADEAAIEMLEATGRNPAALARAFEAITEHSHDYGEKESKSKRSLPIWLRTHPNTDERVEQARARTAPAGALPLSEEGWRIVASACRAASEAEE